MEEDEAVFLAEREAKLIFDAALTEEEAEEVALACYAQRFRPQYARNYPLEIVTRGPRQVFSFLKLRSIREATNMLMQSVPGAVGKAKNQVDVFNVKFLTEEEQSELNDLQ